jgi:hypothetical protein
LDTANAIPEGGIYPSLLVTGDPKQFDWEISAHDGRPGTPKIISQKAICHSIKWDRFRTSVQVYEDHVVTHCNMNGMGNAVEPHFMVLFQKHWLKTIQKYPKYHVYCPSDVQLWHDVEMLYGILQFVFNVSHAQRLFREDKQASWFPRWYCNECQNHEDD